jgi:hypothetical protein
MALDATRRPTLSAVRDVDDALDPIRSMLAAEGFELSISGGEGSPIVLSVAAGPDACEYCLVPKATLRAIALDKLAGRGLGGSLEIEVVYPEDQP